jgi:methionine sulfoxide reductase heme-binding subunit
LWPLITALNWDLLREDLFERRYALAGFAAFLLLVPLAATSTRWAMRKLGKNWKRLHRLVYLAGILAVVHYLWLVKADYAQPLLFAGILAALLAAAPETDSAAGGQLAQRR